MKHLILSIILIAGCRLESQTSRSKDLPDSQLSPRVTSYRQYNRQQLEELFIKAPPMQFYPQGYAEGIHIIADRNNAMVPRSLVKATMQLWKAKRFMAEEQLMIDIMKLPSLYRVGARLRIESLQETLQRYEFTLEDGIFVDSNPSLITDYHDASAPVPLLFSSVRGWIDECRIIETYPSQILLCRSTYRGKFWAHVVLEFT